MAYSRNNLNSVGDALLILIDVLDFEFVGALFDGEFMFVVALFGDDLTLVIALSFLVFRDFGFEGTLSFSEFHFEDFHSFIESSLDVVVLGLEFGDLDLVSLLSVIPFDLGLMDLFGVPLAQCDVEYMIGEVDFRAERVRVVPVVGSVSHDRLTAAQRCLLGWCKKALSHLHLPQLVSVPEAEDQGGDENGRNGYVESTSAGQT